MHVALSCVEIDGAQVVQKEAAIQELEENFNALLRQSVSSAAQYRLKQSIIA
jgi:hypothetical protein